MFQHNRKKGAIILPNLLADILAAETNGLLDVGHYYATTDQTEERIGRAVLVNKIEWEVRSSDVAAAVLVEKTRAIGVENQIAGNLASEISRATAAEGTIASGLAAEISRATAAEGVITANLDTERTARIAGDAASIAAVNTEHNRALAVESDLTTALNAEISRATTRENGIVTDYIAADTALQTALTTVFNNALTAYASKDVRSVIKGEYTDGGTLSIVTLLGANPVDGVHAIFTTSNNLANVATMTSPIALASGEEVIDFGDQYDVTTIGGTVTKVVKIESILKTKFGSIDAAITALQAATTPTAIKSHFSATNWATFTNGVIDVAPSAAPNNDLVTSLADGKAFLDVDQTSTTAGPNGAQTINKQLVDLWASVASITTNGVGGAANGAQKVGSNIELGGNPLTKDTVIAGPYTLTLGATVTVVDGILKMPYFEVGPGNVRAAKTTNLVEVWFDSKGINYEFPAVPNQ
jgi:hypothetical protein